MARSDIKTVHKKSEQMLAAVLEVIASGGTITEAAKQCGVSFVTIHQWKKTDMDFKARFEVAHKQGTDVFLKELRRRAIDGYKEPVFYQGVQCGEITKYSDTLLVTALKMRDPSAFVEHTNNTHTGKDGVPLFTTITRTIVRPKSLEAKG